MSKKKTNKANNAFIISSIKDRYMRYKIKRDMKKLEKSSEMILYFAIAIVTFILYLIVTFYSYYIIMDNIV